MNEKKKRNETTGAERLKKNSNDAAKGRVRWPQGEVQKEGGIGKWKESEKGEKQKEKAKREMQSYFQWVLELWEWSFQRTRKGAARGSCVRASNISCARLFGNSCLLFKWPTAEIYCTAPCPRSCRG
jgi:hypothetical protein